jgi:hypothetical protein
MRDLAYNVSTRGLKGPTQRRHYAIAKALGPVLTENWRETPDLLFAICNALYLDPLDAELRKLLGYSLTNILGWDQLEQYFHTRLGLLFETPVVGGIANYAQEVFSYQLTEGITVDRRVVGSFIQRFHREDTSRTKSTRLKFWFDYRVDLDVWKPAHFDSCPILPLLGWVMRHDPMVLPKIFMHVPNDGTRLFVTFLMENS